ncbi:MAG: hypothetical protein RLZZ124_1696 [Cyanobacteriota bacterium]
MPMSSQRRMPPPSQRRTVQPATLKWQENGELSSHDVFNLVCRLRDVESGETSNELWRLGHKYPAQAPVPPRSDLSSADQES